jgi:hypothetical protein
MILSLIGIRANSKQTKVCPPRKQPINEITLLTTTKPLIQTSSKQPLNATHNMATPTLTLVRFTAPDQTSWHRALPTSSIPTALNPSVDDILNTIAAHHDRPPRSISGQAMWKFTSVMVVWEGPSPAEMNLLGLGVQTMDDTFRMMAQRGWRDHVHIEYR